MRQIILAMFLVLYAHVSFAQDMTILQGTPSMPQPLMDQKLRGAQVYYLGKFDQLDGWALIRTGQPEFYYATPGNQALVMGLLFNGTGELQTTQQLEKLQEAQRLAITDIMQAPAAQTPAASEPTPAPAVAVNDVANTLETNTPANQLFSEVQSASAVTLGNSGVPTFYAFIDPNCTHCQRFLREVESFITSGQVAVRIIPVGFDDKSKKQAAYLLASADGGTRMLSYAKGDATILPEPVDIGIEGVTNNVKILSKWNLMATPIIVYRAAATNEVKLIRGRPVDMAGAVADLRGSAQ